MIGELGFEQAHKGIDEELGFDHSLKGIDVADLLQKGKHEMFEVDVVYDIIALPNYHFLMVHFSDGYLGYYNEHLKCVKRIDKINGENFTPIGIALHLKEKKLFLSDYLNRRIIMTDLQINFLKSIGSFGAEINQFDGPNDLCLLNNNLYVCDYNNKRIQVYNTELIYSQSLMVNYHPQEIKTLNSKLFIQSAESGLFIYNSNDFSLLKKFEHGLCRISKLDSDIYEFNHETKKLFCYDEHANLKEEINLTSVNENLIGVWDGTFIVFNRAFLLIPCSNGIRENI